MMAAMISATRVTWLNQQQPPPQQQQGDAPDADLQTLGVAHRGSAQNAVENSLPAFQQAILDGADILELDVHLTKDRDLAVIHDETLERTHHNAGVVHEMTSQELRAFGIPMLSDVLALDVPLFVEIKEPKVGHYDGLEQILIDQLDQAGADPHTVVISFDEEALKKVHELDQDLVTGLLYSGKPIDMAKKREELGIQYLAPHFSTITRDYVRRAHAQGLKVDAWVVNNPREMQKMIDIHCDAVTTDQMPLLHGLLTADAQFPRHRA